MTVMGNPSLTLPEPHSTLASPRSSTSSSNPSACPPLTPMLDLTAAVEQMAIPDTASDAYDDITPPKITRPQSAFANYSFSTATQPASRSIPNNPPHSPLISPSELPKADFSFGTCPKTPFMGTPTAEMGQFEYPEHGPEIHDPYPSTNASTAHPLPLGQAYRRSSIVSRSSIDRRPSQDYPSPPATRRSTTTSTIHTLPSAGRRPSILHSSTNPPLLPVSASPSTSRRPSLMFPPKALPISIPPSLLARRGSLPAAQLFGLPNSDLPRLASARSSLAAPSAAGFTTSTPALYHRRESILSESGGSSHSSRTISNYTYTEENTRRSSLRNPDSPSYARRSSLPFTEPPHPPSPSARFAERRTRQSSTFSSSLSSSEESNEEDDEVDPLPTPSSFGSGGSVGGPGFSDPWASAGKALTGEVERRESMGAGAGSGTERAGRPALETIASDDTERGHRSK